MFSQGSVGVIELNGVIMDSKKTLERLERFEESDEIKGVVLRINSPGGAVAPSQEIYQAVANFKKPLVASMGSVAASGGYYVAMGAKKVYANPGTITGSIGVIMEFANLSKLYEWAKVTRYSIKTGKFKDVGAEYREMRPDERELLQNMVNDVLLQFKEAVAKGRKLPLEQIAKIADGRIFSGTQAKNLHLVDDVGSLQDAINDVATQAHIKGKPSVVYPSSGSRKWLDLIMDNGSKDESEAESETESETGIFGRLASALLGQGPSHDIKSALGVMPAGVYWLWDAAR